MMDQERNGVKGRVSRDGVGYGVGEERNREGRIVGLQSEPPTGLVLVYISWLTNFAAGVLISTSRSSKGKVGRRRTKPIMYQ